MSTLIDFRSDTVTKPTLPMRDAMFQAAVGDDVYGDDPTVAELESYAAKLVGKEASLFVPTGTFGNQLALYTHCERGSEVVLGNDCHIVSYEAGAAAVIAAVQLRTIETNKGMLPLEKVKKTIRSSTDIHYPKTSLICIENAHTSGYVLTGEYMQELGELAKSYGVPIHLDGARIFNAAISLDVEVPELTNYADSVMFCLSKGLCAPVGSILAGDKEFINAARRKRKQLGGGMRQVGILAAAGIVALQSMVPRLKDDHELAEKLASKLGKLPNVTVFTEQLYINMVFFSIPNIEAEDLLEHLRNEYKIKVGMPKDNIWRIAIHHDIDESNVDLLSEALKKYLIDLPHHSRNKPENGRQNKLNIAGSNSNVAVESEKIINKGVQVSEIEIVEPETGENLLQEIKEEVLSLKGLVDDIAGNLKPGMVEYDNEEMNLLNIDSSIELKAQTKRFKTIGDLCFENKASETGVFNPRFKTGLDGKRENVISKFLENDSKLNEVVSDIDLLGENHAVSSVGSTSEIPHLKLHAKAVTELPGKSDVGKPDEYLWQSKLNQMGDRAKEFESEYLVDNEIALSVDEVKTSDVGNVGQESESISGTGLNNIAPELVSLSESSISPRNLEETISMPTKLFDENLSVDNVKNFAGEPTGVSSKIENLEANIKEGEIRESLVGLPPFEEESVSWYEDNQEKLGIRSLDEFSSLNEEYNEELNTLDELVELRSDKKGASKKQVKKNDKWKKTEKKYKRRKNTVDKVVLVEDSITLDELLSKKTKEEE